MTEEITLAAYLHNPTQEGLLSLLREHRPAVFGICYQVLRHAQDAEDATQEVFLKMLDGLKDAARIRDFRHWLYRVSYHTALDIKRKRMRRETRERRTAEWASAAGDGSPRFTEDQAAELFEHVARLDESLRAVVTAHYIEKRTLDLIARDEGVTVRAVCKRLRKAVEALKGTLTRAGFAPSIVMGVGAYLESVTTPASAAELITPAVAAKAAAIAKSAAGAGAAAGGTSGAALIIGGLLVKAKVAAVAAAGLAAVVAVGYGVQAARSKESARPSASETPIPALSEARSNKKVADPETRRLSDKTTAGVPISPAKPSTGAVPFKEAAPVPAPSAVPAAEEAALSDAEKAASKVLMQALEAAISILDDTKCRDALRRLGVNLSDEDFAKAFARAAGMKTDREKDRLRGRFMCVLDQWTESDPQAAASWVLKATQGIELDRSNKILGYVLLTWAKKDGPAALSFARTIPAASWRQFAAAQIQLMADPAAASATLAALPEDRRDRAINDVVRLLCFPDGDPQPWIDRLPAGALRDKALQTAAWSIYKSRYPEAEALARQMADDDARRRLLQDLAQRAGKPYGYSASADTAIEEFRSALAKQKGDVPSDAWMGTHSKLLGLFKTWTQEDPQAAADYALRMMTSIPEYQQGGWHVANVAGVWAKSDPSAAARWAEQIRDAGTRASALNQIAAEWVRTDPAAALALADQMPEDRKTTASQELAEAWAARDPQGALAWFQQLPLGTMREAALKGVLAGWASGDPPAAAAFAAALPHGTAEAAAVGGIAAKWAKLDLHAALAWIETLPAGPFHDQAMRAAAVAVSKSNVSRAIGMADKISDAAARDAIYSHVALFEWRSDPQAALGAILKLSNLTDRDYNDLYHMAIFPATSWAKNDPRAALAWSRQLPATAPRKMGVGEPTREPLAKAVRTGILDQWAATNADAARDWVLQSGLGEDEQRDILKTIEFRIQHPH